MTNTRSTLLGLVVRDASTKVHTVASIMTWLPCLSTATANNRVRTGARAVEAGRFFSGVNAAHIIPDSAPGGDPVVNNGLCLCKIHHAAYDQNFLGIAPEYRVHVRQDILAETDGPMLRHGLQEMHGRTIVLPSRQQDHPDPDRLARRFSRFLSA